MTLDELLQDLAAATTAAKALKARRDELLDELETLRILGEADSKIEGHGCRFTWSAGRPTYIFPQALVDLRKHLEEEEQAAVATGAAAPKPLKPFWTINIAKE